MNKRKREREKGIEINSRQKNLKQIQNDLYKNGWKMGSPGFRGNVGLL